MFLETSLYSKCVHYHTNHLESIVLSFGTIIEDLMAIFTYMLVSVPLLVSVEETVYIL